MTNETFEKLTAINSLMGDDMIEAIYRITGKEKISMATLKKISKKEKIKVSLSEKNSIHEVAKEMGMHRSTIYRNFKK